MKNPLKFYDEIDPPEIDRKTWRRINKKINYLFDIETRIFNNGRTSITTMKPKVTIDQ